MFGLGLWPIGLGLVVMGLSGGVGGVGGGSVVGLECSWLSMSWTVSSSGRCSPGFLAEYMYSHVGVVHLG